MKSLREFNLSLYTDPKFSEFNLSLYTDPKFS